MYRSGIVFVDFLLNVPVQTSQNRNGYTLLPHDSYLKGYKKEALRSKIRPRFCLFPAKWIFAKGLWRYILSFCTYCRRRQYVPTLTAHIAVHRHILSPATICAETTLLSLLHNGRRNVQSCIGTYCCRRHYVPWPCAHFVADILSWQIISWQKIDVKRERKIDTHTHAHTHARTHTHTHAHTGRLTDWQTDRRLDKVHVR